MAAITLRQVAAPAADFVQVNMQLIESSVAFKRLRRWIGILVAVGVIGTALNYLTRDLQFSGPVILLLVMFILGGVYLVFGRQKLRQQLAATYERGNLPLRHPTDFTLTTATIHSHNALHDSTSAWSSVLRADKAYPWLLLYVTEKSCFWLDLRRIELPASDNDLMQLLATHRIPVRELSPIQPS